MRELYCAWFINKSNFASAILMESGLGFLGIGAQPPTPTWGGMVKNNFNT